VDQGEGQFMAEPAVELTNVTKRFDDVVAVDDASLRIEDGEFFSLLGPSGAARPPLCA
jgi:ABC-type Fe3+/spermidine/putrescine transport system ATPase subunit